MTLPPGTKLGRYEIRSKLGEGGMGEVYRSRDQKLNRDVAIKVLPAQLSQDSERLQRFEQEAQAAGALNHPNILGVFDVGTHDGLTYLVTELLEGEELRERLNRGPLPQRTAIDFAQQIAAGLAAAHEKGIVHRDLKPENLFITTNDRVKILDFGLAKLRPQRSETISSEIATAKQITDPGTVMGTVGYMSPEQVRGHQADHRSDIFSFGAILYEMLAGQRAFRRETMAETMTAILKEEPPELSETNSKINPQLEKVVRRCLQKTPERRFHSAHDLGFALESLTAPSGFASQSLLAQESEPTISRGRFFDRGSLAIAAVAVLVAALAVIMMYVSRRSGETNGETVRQFTLAPPAEGALDSHSLALLFSPDGTHIVSSLVVSGRTKLFDRPLAAFAAHPIDGTEGASDPFFSPDGQWLGFFANGSLKKVPLNGGAPETICKAENPRGGVWSSDGTIIFTPGTDAPLYRVSASGGAAEALSTIDGSAHERSHRWPDVLPSGKSVLFSVAYDVGNPLDNANVALLDLNTHKHKILIKGGAFARYLSAGYIVYARGNAMQAVPFNLKTLQVTGSPVTVLENVMMSPSNARVQFSLSRDGDLIYLEGRSDDSRDAAQPLVWLDRQGSEQILTEARQRFSKPRLTADGRTLFVEVADPEAAIWAYDMNRGTLTRVTHGGVSYGPVPSPDGTRVAYEATRDGVAGALLARIDGSGEQRLTSTKRVDIPTSWSPDGKVLALTSFGESGHYEVRLIPVEGDPTPQMFVQGPFNAGGARFSQDGHWVAYVSDESGSNEVYVRPYPEGTRQQISAAGGTQPVWSSNGRELFFRSGDQLMAVSITPGTNFSAGKPVALFSRSTPDDSSGMAYGFMADYDVSNDGRRFVFPKHNPDSSNVPRPRVILDWFFELKRITTAGR
ncbi:MAG TPA: protein kinase [Pyrinomonadaceae bacterium]|nr:protein kinase [Pyrinomonadaceae bacterium]